MAKKVLMVVICMSLLVCTTLVAQVNGKTKLTVWTYGGLKPFVDAIEPDFELKHPDIELEETEIGPWDLLDKLMISIAAGTGAPDLCAVVLRRFTPFMEGGGIFDITEKMQESGWADRYIPAQLALASHKGRIYGVPDDYPPSMVWYRKDIFEKYGIDTEETWATWDGLIKAGKKVADKGHFMFDLFVPSGAWGSSFFLQFLMSKGGNVFDDAGKVIEDNQKAIDTLQWMYDLKFKHKVAYTEKFFTAENWESLSNGTVLTSIVGPWGEMHFLQYCKHAKGMWGVKPFPLWYKDAPKLTGIWGGNAWCIPEQSGKKEQAWVLLEYIQEHHKELYEVLQMLAPLKDLDLQPYLQKKSKLTDTVLAEVLVAREPFPFNYYGGGEAEGIIGNAVDEAFSGKKTPKQAWLDCEKQLKAKLGR